MPPAGSPRNLLVQALETLRTAEWLTPDRALGYARLLGAATIIFTIAAFARIMLPAFSDPHWRPLASDFDPFWSGARLALSGHPAAAYDMPTIRAMEDAGAQSHGTLFYYLYPPVWMMLCLPLAALPYALALPAFLIAGAAAFATTIRAILPGGWPIITVLAFPAALMNIVIGQNGFVTATCFAGAMLLLDRAPMPAGICLGMLAFKPQLAIGIPIALLAARRWRTLLACAATAASLLLLSWAVLGSAAWSGFLAATPFIRSVLQDPGIWPKLVSIFTAARLFGLSIHAALALQAIAALCALACVFAICRRKPGAGPEIAALAAASMLCTPYLMDYDLVCTAIPMAWLVRCAATDGWRPWEKSTLALLYVVPLLARNLNVGVGLPVAPVLLLVLLVLMMQRQGGKRFFLAEEAKTFSQSGVR